MSRIKADPLLTGARAILILMALLFCFVMVILALALGAILTVERGEVLAQIAEFEAPQSLYWAVIAAFVLLLMIFGAMLRFLQLLMHMIKSVDIGDPFAPANADRLTAMGWLTIAIQVALAILWGINEVVVQYVDNTGLEGSFSLAGWFLALVLFILARVFRHGTDLRTEVEGTV